MPVQNYGTITIELKRSLLYNIEKSDKKAIWQRGFEHIMKNFPIKKLVLAALLAALTFVATTVIRIPVPTGEGYINLGDCVVLLSGFILGPYFGAFSAGIGSAFADVLSAPIYAPATFIIKALMALIGGLMFRFSKKHITVWTVICGLISEAVMVIGYYVFEAFMLGYGWAPAALNIPPNIFQGITGVAAAAILIQIFIQKKKRTYNNDLEEDLEEDES